MRSAVDAALPYFVVAVLIVALGTVVAARRWRCDRCQTLNQAWSDDCFGCGSDRDRRPAALPPCTGDFLTCGCADCNDYYRNGGKCHGG